MSNKPKKTNKKKIISTYFDTENKYEEELYEFVQEEVSKMYGASLSTFMKSVIKFYKDNATNNNIIQKATENNVKEQTKSTQNKDNHIEKLNLMNDTLSSLK